MFAPPRLNLGEKRGGLAHLYTSQHPFVIVLRSLLFTPDQPSGSSVHNTHAHFFQCPIPPVARLIPARTALH